MAEWLTAKVVENKQWNDRLHSLRVETDFPTFKAGQFTRLALEIDGEMVSRPFSLVNAPDESPLDFYFIEVPDGVLSSKLANMQAGDDIWVAPKAAGLLTVDQLPAAKHLYLVATGTGVGPFLSIAKTSLVWDLFEKVVLVHAVRYKDELAYPETIAEIQANHQDDFIYVPMVSREACDFALSGRIPQAIEDGRLEHRTGLNITPEDSQFMLCGNPAMVQDTMALLIEERGLKKHSRREPGHISIEKYW
ncbi:ferredoxin--NADP reductase [Methylophaga thiooxydans]|uniref:ferredoxin--NADP(+) reductase n=1 Tax=Methylophaga thiooxydans DMS010 TaxID=637616 RepID=C0N3U3_9GAMM|nr:ferredoxin--NADP reductase [Methylophaga thiooxydans]EEF80505.1 Oxidoreductase NAD-binding domain protein [Methylophaga thiooxydans DMS010]